jgi:Rrf2 family protein
MSLILMSLDLLYPDMYYPGMKLSDGVEWTIHCCTVLGVMPPTQAVPAAVLAEFHGVPVAYLAKQLQAVSRAGIVESIPGRGGGYRLAKSGDRISLLDVVLAVDGEEPAFRCSEIRQQGPSALAPDRYVRPCSIARAMWRAEDAWRTELRATTIADLVADLGNAVDPEQTEKAFVWLLGQLT